MGDFSKQLGQSFTQFMRVTGSLRLTVVLLLGTLIYLMDGSTAEAKIVLASAKPIALSILGGAFLISDALRKIVAPEGEDDTSDSGPSGG